MSIVLKWAALCSNWLCFRDGKSKMGRDSVLFGWCCSLYSFAIKSQKRAGLVCVLAILPASPDVHVALFPFLTPASL